MRDYHLHELEIARNVSDPFRLLPEVPAGVRRILDVGCGAGQTLIALKPGCRCFGIDPDAGALQLGRELTQDICFVLGAGEALPFAGGSFDFVFSRVALPYMHIGHALAEMRRVLVPGGRLWLSLHDAGIALRQFRSGGGKAKLYALYVLTSGISFHISGHALPPVRGKRESFQTERGMRLALKRAQFQIVTFARTARHFTVTAQAI